MHAESEEALLSRSHGQSWDPDPRPGGLPRGCGAVETALTQAGLWVVFEAGECTCAAEVVSQRPCSS